MFFSKPVFTSQNDAVLWLLQEYKKKGKRLPLPELKNFKYDGKNTIASHSKITSNIRKKLRKSGFDLICHELHTIKNGVILSNHTAYEIVDGIRSVTKIITTQYV